MFKHQWHILIKANASIARKNKKLDVQLAIEYKDRQRNVVSSLLTACYKGRKMLEAELEKLDG